MKFWDKVYACGSSEWGEHVWDGDYYDHGTCGTPYCSWTERRCVRCKVYEVLCGCGFMNGLSGWPMKRLLKKEGRG